MSYFYKPYIYLGFDLYKTYLNRKKNQFNYLIYIKKLKLF